MAHQKISYALLLIAVLCLGCKHDPVQTVVRDDGYPKEVSKIFQAKCATSGCHNEASYMNAANLNMTTWNELFKGATTGSVVIPYRSDYSSLCYFINTDTSIGIALQPTMPYNQQPLTNSEYNTIRAWIGAGAPNDKGEIKFSGNSDRSKIYVANRMCDVVTVMDASTLLPMRYVDVGIKQEQEFPYCIKVAPDKRHWYVSFFSITGIIQKFDAATDRPAGILNLGEGAWTSFALTADSRYGYFVDNSAQGKIVYADLEAMMVIATYSFNGGLHYPIGIAINEALHKVYVGTTSGNFVYCINIADPLHPTMKELPIDGTATVQYHSTLNPAELLADAAKSICFIACAYSKDIRVVNMKTDQVIAVIPLPAAPAFMAFSAPLQKLFVSCPDDTASFSSNRGSVQIIDLTTMSVLKAINTGYQPCGLAINEAKNVVAVANANISIKGPASHHASRCGAKNGNVTFIDLAALSLVPKKKIEVAVYPFGVTSR